MSVSQGDEDRAVAEYQKLVDANPADTDYRFFVVKPCGEGEHVFSETDAEFQAAEVRVVLRSGLKQVAYDGEMGEKSEEFVFSKREPLTVYCCRTD